MVTTHATAAEYAAWESFMKSSAGRWTVDPIHNGRNGVDLLVFRGCESNDGSGVYIRVSDATVDAGSYAGALPHIGEAMFSSRWSRDCRTNLAAMDVVRRHTGARI